MPEFFLAEWLGKPLWMWTGFLSIVIALLAFDLGIWHKDDKEMGITESLWLSAFYFAFAIVYGAGVSSTLAECKGDSRISSRAAVRLITPSPPATRLQS